MKQIEKTPQIIAALRNAVGQDVSPDNYAIYEATAFNTLPIRKKHPLYQGAQANRQLLEEMAASLQAESLPLQIMHDGSELPVGRIFEGKVIDTANGPELRVLFFVDKQNEELVRNLDLGIVDQVSVSVLPKHLLCSACGFDYLGAEATFENFVTGTCPDGHVLGENGVHAKLVGLDTWMEMSLVNRGGAQNARIVGRDKSAFSTPVAQRLAASGVDPNLMVLTAQLTEPKKMDFEALAAQLVDLRVEKAGLDAKLAALTASNEALTTQVTDLTAKLAEAGDAAASLAAKDAQIATLTATSNAAVAALKEVAKKLLIAGGDVDPTVPETVEELSAIITEKQEALAASLVIGGRSASSDKGSKPDVVLSGAFRTVK